MKEILYKTFSMRAHLRNIELKVPNTCQLELTFRCGLRCRHCYSDCYNKPSFTRRELKTQEVKNNLDKIYSAGVIWLCLTGGDPLARADFPDIYGYAKDKGFIVTVFTNGYSLTKEILDVFEKKPPFVIEMTLNAAKKGLYEKISGRQGSFELVMKAIRLLRQRGLALKVKTLVTRDNVMELKAIERSILGLKLKFLPEFVLYPRLNGDPAPCSLRVPVKKLLSLHGKKSLADEVCRSPGKRITSRQHGFYSCAVEGGDGFYLDPYGNMFLCPLIREPKYNIATTDVREAFGRLLLSARNAKFLTDSKCGICGLREKCLWCPGKAFLESKDKEYPIEYYCRLAKGEVSRC